MEKDVMQECECGSGELTDGDCCSSCFDEDQEFYYMELGAEQDILKIDIAHLERYLVEKRERLQFVNNEIERLEK